MAGRRRRFLILGAATLVASAALVRALVLPVTIGQVIAQTTSQTTVPATEPQTLPKLEPADPKTLRSLLPSNVSTLKQADPEAGLRSLGEMRSTYAQATYIAEAGPDAGHASVKIVDYIAMPDVIDSVAPWKNLTIETETDAEYSRTVTLGAFKGLEAYVKQTRSGTINVLVAGRFVVTVEVTGLPPEALRDTVSAMKIDDLAKLAK